MLDRLLRGAFPLLKDEIVTIAQKTSHAGFFLLKTMQLRHQRFDGAMSAELEREVFVAGDATTVLPYDPVRDCVLLIEQFRMGPYGRGDKHPWMLEPIAGRIDGGEGAEAVSYADLSARIQASVAGRALRKATRSEAR